MIVLDTPADCWSYVNEGNQNLVIRYEGQDALFKGKVLRLHKNRDGEVQEVDEQTILFKQQFHETVMRSLLGDDYIVTIVPVKTSRSFLEHIAHRVEPYRPTKRLDTHIALNSPFSLLMDDLMISNPSTFVFELKPKWGFKPRRGHWKKQTYCRYCLHAHWRQQPTHGYCPLDLYSKDPLRIQKALTILFKKPIEKTLKATHQGKPVSLLSLEDVHFSLLTAILQQDPLLSRLKQLQSQLDSLDVEGIWPLFKEHRASLSDDSQLWQHVTERFLNRRPCLDKERVMQRIYEYVLSMTFKDCSLMISISPSVGQKQIQIGDRVFYYRMTVIDIDLKDVNKIPYWYQLDQTIVQYAIDTNYQKPTACHA
ncbi:inositol-pentakisphosphate 2-kinase [Choanephora cucurbitarum]|nr:inositol-pentakisphosphate 2-kinase [Choanephora cucurbitarum]